MVQHVDVLICGSGSAGLCAGLWLSIYGIKSVKILERRSGPMTMGQADGVQCRTVEVFESFGLSEELLREAYHVLEVAFWSPDGKGGLRRTNRAADTQPGLSHQPHVILNQARINALLLEAMRRTNGQEVDYGYSVKSVEVDSASTKDPNAYCNTVVTEKDGQQEVFKAKFVLVSLSWVSFGILTLIRDVMAPTAWCASLWVLKWSATRVTPFGVSWMSILAPTSRTSAASVPSARTPAPSC